MGNKKGQPPWIFWENSCDEELTGNKIWAGGGKYNCKYYQEQGINVSNEKSVCYGYIKKACSFCGECQSKFCALQRWRDKISFLNVFFSWSGRGTWFPVEILP